MSAKGFESPLISHARMRAMYRALVETRALGAKLGRKVRLPKGLEACWVGTAIDLKAGDLTSDAGGSAVIEYVRGVGTRQTARAATLGEVRRLLGAEPKKFAGTAADRLLCAVGAAMAVKSAGTGQVVMAYVSAAEMTPAEWKRVMAAGGEGDLPLVIVVTPAAGAERPGAGRVPMIPVDAGDALAIYRVAQESILRARGEGGLAMIECVATGADPVKMLGRQLVAKGIATERWVAGVEEQFRGTIARL